MKNSLLALLLLFCAPSLMAQQSCKDIQEAFPKEKTYKKYHMVQEGCVPERMYMANFLYGKFDDEQMMSLSITDTKGREGRLIDVKGNLEAAKKTKTPSFIRISKLNVGKENYVARNTGGATKINWVFVSIIDNRYVLELMMTNTELNNLADFENYISSYIKQVNTVVLNK